MQLKMVVLPAPLGPMSPTIWPRPTLNDTSSLATSPPKRLVTFWTSRSALMGPPRSPGAARGGAVMETGSRAAPGLQDGSFRLSLVATAKQRCNHLLAPPHQAARLVDRDGDDDHRVDDEVGAAPGATEGDSRAFFDQRERRRPH